MKSLVIFQVRKRRSRLITFAVLSKADVCDRFSCDQEFESR